MIAFVPPQRRKSIIAILAGFGVAAIGIGSLIHRDFLSGFGVGLVIVAAVSFPILMRKGDPSC